MKKLFINSYKEKHYVERYSYKFWFACSIEIVGILCMGSGLIEIELLNKFNPATALLQFGGLAFVVGSFMYAKVVKH